MDPIVAFRRKRVGQLVSEHWPGCEAVFLPSREPKIIFRVRSEGGRFRTGRITVADMTTRLDRDWLAAEVERGIFRPAV
jgi:hypothetical protein